MPAATSRTHVTVQVRCLVGQRYDQGVSRARAPDDVASLDVPGCPDPLGRW
jgi:hypothetical protein